MKFFVISLFLCLFIVVPCAYAQQKSSIEAKGAIYFSLVAPSSIMQYPRGDGRNEHWEAGLDLILNKSIFELEVDSAFIGGSTFDSPDSLRLMFRGSMYFGNHWVLDLVHTDGYSLNKAAVPDPNARRLGSSVNNWWIGPRWQYIGTENGFEAAVRFSFSRDEPVWNRHFTKPYATRYAMMSAYHMLNKSLMISGKGEGYFATGMDKSRVVVEGKLVQYLGKTLAFELKGIHVMNAGLDETIKDARGRSLENSSGIYYGIRILF
jgi:hypothetical protein